MTGWIIVVSPIHNVKRLQYHALAFPCQRDGLGWRDVRANRSVLVEPTHWRLWDRGRADGKSH